MAIYIGIRKENETAESVVYRFENSDGSRVGRFLVDKKTGHAELLQQMPGDARNNMFMMARHKVKRAFGAGNLPDNTCWAS